MKPNELRIGNYVYNNLEIIKLHKKDLIYLFTSDNMHFANPIPLTEEWLLKFRFRTEESSCFELDNIQINTSRELVWINIKRKYNIEIGMPNYVHQLQNLYFALTNTEL